MKDIIFTEDDHWEIINYNSVFNFFLVLICKECEAPYRHAYHRAALRCDGKPPDEEILALYNLYKHLDRI